MDVSFIRECLEETKRAYLESRNNLLWLEQYRLENQNYRDYEGREILELLQNADDAGSAFAEMKLDSAVGKFSIRNYGGDTRVFTESGMRSIMASYLSDKKNNGGNASKLIGAKGLGFKSILNWSTEVTVASGNVEVRFGDGIVEKFWKELRPNVPGAEVYEDEAAKDGHLVPLPVLRIPEISQREEPESPETSIELWYCSEQTGRKIRQSLENFEPETLLFLHNLRNIKICIDGIEKEYTLTCTRVKDVVEECSVGGSTWLVSREEGEIEGRRYEVAAALNLDGPRQKSYNLYTFFPTEEEFPFPCIIHATLELNASRKAIQTGEKINSALMPLVADRIIALADELKARLHSWDAYTLVYGDFLHKTYSVYATELQTILAQKAADAQYVPVLSGRYARAAECYCYNDAFFDFVDANGGGEIFGGLMLKGHPETFTAAADPEAKGHIEGFASGIKDCRLLGRFIKIVCDFYSSNPAPGVKADLRLLTDDSGDIIPSTAYLNTGRKIADIPEFLNIKYVNEGLKDSLLAEFGFQGSEQDQLRSIATALGASVAKVSASDVSGIKRMLMLSKTDFNDYSQAQIREIIACLFKLYISNTSEFEKSSLECYLPTEAGHPRAARELVFGDRRFPDGIANMNLSRKIYQLNDLVAFPDFLGTADGQAREDGNLTVQNFYAALGVNKYFRTEEVCYGDDRDYLRLNGVKETDIPNAAGFRVGPGINTATIPVGLGNWGKLSLTDLLRLIRASGLTKDIADNMDVRYYYLRLRGPEPLKTNYLVYLLRKNTAAGRLKDFVLSTREWIVDPGCECDCDFMDDLVVLVLKRLGAKVSYSDFSPAELYRMIEARAQEFETSRNPTGIKEFYHRVKMAFSQMGDYAGLPADVNLRMLCTQNGEFRLADSRKIFYSNNWNSEKLRSQLPILCLQLRDGDDEVSKFFGCRRVKDLKVTLRKRMDNEPLSRELNKHLEVCKPYFLALASKNSGDGSNFDKDKKSLVGRLSVDVVASASYLFENEGLTTEEEALKEGEMVFAGNVPAVCCRASLLEVALADPRFCNAVAEAVCVWLNLSARENLDSFHRIITATGRELEFMAGTFNPALWQSCQQAYGISDAEVGFWQNVFAAAGKSEAFDKEKLRSHKQAYIMDCLGLGAGRASAANFVLFHVQQLQSERNRLVVPYKIWLHNTSKDSLEKQRQYLRLINEFQDERWVEEAFGAWNERFRLAPDYKGLVVRKVAELFGFNPEAFDPGNAPVPAPLGKYEGLDLSNDYDKSLLYFEGNEEYFKQLAAEASLDDATGAGENSGAGVNAAEVSADLKISLVGVERHDKIPTGSDRPGKRSHGARRRQLSEADLERIGDEAEDKVLKALTAPGSGYEVGHIYSEHLNPSSGKNRQGYDLEYRRKGEEIFRCLEIKNFTAGSIIVSRNEYETARSEKYKDRYDVALVTNDAIRIWENAFSDESKYTKSADDYIVTFRTTPKHEK